MWYIGSNISDSSDSDLTGLIETYRLIKELGLIISLKLYLAIIPSELLTNIDSFKAITFKKTALKIHDCC
ncbi:hypothetical protein RIR_jg27995.t1 [Rhizophagus irregularis DAOM 181602=DAOM 197198]|nr:hypothetical protein RIR_jg27995.t1 [Rhizophagus irregularis DAOM 181602=DAOM 197198]